MKAADCADAVPGLPSAIAPAGDQPDVGAARGTSRQGGRTPSARQVNSDPECGPLHDHASIHPLHALDALDALWAQDISPCSAISPGAQGDSPSATAGHLRHLRHPKSASFCFTLSKEGPAAAGPVARYGRPPRRSTAYMP
jgi:hypothetical protein